MISVGGLKIASDIFFAFFALFWSNAQFSLSILKINYLQHKKKIKNLRRDNGSDSSLMKTSVLTTYRDDRDANKFLGVVYCVSVAS